MTAQHWEVVGRECVHTGGGRGAEEGQTESVRGGRGAAMPEGLAGRRVQEVCGQR